MLAPVSRALVLVPAACVLLWPPSSVSVAADASPETQQANGAFGVSRYGQALFHANPGGPP